VNPTPIYSPQPAGSGVKTALVAAALVALLVFNVYLYFALDHTRTDLVKMRETMQTEISSLKDATSVTTASQRRSVETLKQELEAARRQANQAAGQAKQEAVVRAEQLAKQLADEQARQHQQVQSQISSVQQQADAKIGAVSGDVNSVKSDLGSTKSELEKTIANLNKVTGDLGVQSGYIATNSKELAALKRLGERNYFEFNLGKTKQPQRVGDISLLLRKTDPKHNKYTVDVLADDKKYEKKDKNMNEPVQFYVAKARQPYELVVNQIKKNQIVGYLSTPKDTTPRN
jgi:F0F1-type ATP synthase membrane subunit b/b'